MKSDEMIEEADKVSREKYPNDALARLAFKCGYLQGYIQRMDAEIESLKQFQKNDDAKITDLKNQLFEKE